MLKFQGAVLDRGGCISVPASPAYCAHYLCDDLQVSTRAAIPETFETEQNQRPLGVHFFDSLHNLVTIFPLQHRG